MAAKNVPVTTAQVRAARVEVEELRRVGDHPKPLLAALADVHVPGDQQPWETRHRR